MSHSEPSPSPSTHRRYIPVFDLKLYRELRDTIARLRKRIDDMKRQRRRRRPQRNRRTISTASIEAAKCQDILQYLDRHGTRYMGELDQLVREADARGAVKRARELRQARVILLAAGFAPRPMSSEHRRQRRRARTAAYGDPRSKVARARARAEFGRW